MLCQSPAPARESDVFVRGTLRDSESLRVPLTDDTSRTQRRLKSLASARESVRGPFTDRRTSPRRGNRG